MKFAIQLTLSLFAISASAQVRHVVFDLDSTLVQGIPASKVSDVKQTEVLVIDVGRKYSYVVRPHAKEIIQKLIAEDRIIAHISSDLPQAHTDAILNAVTIHGSNLKTVIERALGKVLYSGDKPVALKEISTDVENTVFITSKTGSVSDPASQTMLLGEYQYYFDTYKLAQAEIASLTAAGYIASHQAHLPASEDVFDREHNKLAMAYLAILTSLGADDYAKSALKEFNSPIMLANAQTIAQNNYNPLLYSLQDRACSKKDLIAGTTTPANTMECVEYFHFDLAWDGDICSYFTDQGIALASLSIEECVRKLPVESLWKGKSKDQCFAFAQGEPKLKLADESCAKRHAIYDAKKKFYLVIDHFDGMEALSPQEIIKHHLEYEPKFSLTYYDPPSKRVSGVSFPRNGQLLWRAMDSVQFDREQAIRAMFGDRSSNVESKAFTHLKALLTGRTSPFPGIALDGEIQTELNKVKADIPFSETKASNLTKKIFDKYFLSLPADEVKNYFLDYWSVGYADWNPWGIFSSISPAVCYTYNKDVLVSFKEQKQRSSDLNFWNYSVNSSWKGGYGSGHHGDTGEFITPGHVEGRDIIGYFETVPVVKKVRLALLKVSYKGAEYIAGVLNPQDSNCLTVDEKKLSIKTCDFTQDFAQVTNMEAGVSPSRSAVSADFIIKLCADEATCDVDSDLADRLGLGENQAPSLPWANDLKKISVNGMRPKVFTAP